MNKLNKILSITTSKDVLHRAIKVALIVGIILNLINQGETIFILALDEINYYKFFSNFSSSILCFDVYSYFNEPKKEFSILIF